MRLAIASLALICSATLAESSDYAGMKVVKLVTRKDWKEQWTATAFFISPTRLLTAAHTFAKSNDQWIVLDGKEVHCHVVRVDFKKDIAVLESDKRSSDFYRLAAKIVVKGFPLGGALVEASGYIDDKRVHSKIYFSNGMSGGPVEDENGCVIGMGVQGDSEKGDDACKFIPASILAEFLK
jgi:S1-C subfamily serine protease